MFSGIISVRDRVQFGSDNEAKVTAIAVFDNGAAIQRQCAAAGEIAKLYGLADVQIGDTIGEPRISADEHYFAPPTLETVVVPSRTADKGPLRVALAQLAEQDPLINVRQDDIRQELFVSLYGEVQKEVIEATLATDFGLEVEFRESTTICIERPVAVGEAVEFMKQRGNPFLATVGLRIEPAPPGGGIEYRLDSEVLGRMPPAFFKAVEDTVHETLQQGLCGWQVTDCVVTMTHAGYLGKHGLGHQYFNKSMSSTGEDFRGITPLVVMSALRQAGTIVCEPLHRFHLEIPADTFGAAAPVLARLRALPLTQDARGTSYALEGQIPAARVHELQQLLPALSRGEGVLESSFDRYEPVTGTTPTRPRTDKNPLDRKEYLLHITRRV
jgi:ribosomal protection tetracycline resistance protein